MNFTRCLSPDSGDTISTKLGDIIAVDARVLAFIAYSITWHLTNLFMCTLCFRYLLGFLHFIHSINCIQVVPDGKRFLVAHGSLLAFCLCLTNLRITVQKQYTCQLTLMNVKMITGTLHIWRKPWVSRTCTSHIKRNQRWLFFFVLSKITLGNYFMTYYVSNIIARR